MIVLHAGWLDGHLFLWAEGALEAGSTARRRGRPSKKPKPRPFPYNPDMEVVTTRLRQAAPEVYAVLNRGWSAPERLIAWLPSRRGRPIPSSPLIGDPPYEDGEMALFPWWITAIPLQTDQVIDLLAAAASRQLLGPGVMAGEDLRYWVRALELAASAVARQRFLPAVGENRGQYRACWQPVWTDRDHRTLTVLAERMPGACRALARSGSRPPASAPAQVLEGFVSGIVDHLVRGPALVHAPGGVPAGMRSSNLHDHWLEALRASEGLLSGKKRELVALAQAIGEWRRPLQLASAPFRLCFRLEEPLEERPEGCNSDRGPDRWYLAFLLQARDDPSLLVPVDEAWGARGSTAAALRRHGLDSRELILSSLGRAARIHPLLETALASSVQGNGGKGLAPGCSLDTRQAYQFLSETAPLLEAAGFGVLLPAWWTGRRRQNRLALRARVKSPAFQVSGGLSLAALVEVDWQAVLGDQVLSRQELRALARLKQPLVQLRGRWVELRPEEIQGILATLQNRSATSLTGSEALRLALGAQDQVDGLPVEGVEASGWLADLLELLQAGDTSQNRFQEVPPPDGFQGSLRPYQLRGYSWLAFLSRWGLGACLADDMGLGKTVQALALVQRYWERAGWRAAGAQGSDHGRDTVEGEACQAGPTLLVCPTSVIDNWAREARRFTPNLPVLIHHGPDRLKGEEFRRQAAQHGLVITSYTLLHRDRHLLTAEKWSGVILDEAQNIKNPETRQSQAARALKADYRLALTGTPVENNVGDLWSIMEFLNPGFLGSQAAFRRQYLLPIQVSRSSEAAARLKRLTGPFILRRVKTDRSIIADLPEKIETKVFCHLTREQASLYQTVVDEVEEALEDAEGMERRGLILSALTRLKQICNHPAHFLGDGSTLRGRSGKLSRLTELLEEVLAEGDRALLFTQFAEMGSLLQRYLEETFGREVLFLHGGVSRQRRDHMVERFQSESGPPFLVLSLKAGGTGLNLTRANHVFHFDRWWNPAVEDQATDRAFRIGQAKNVQVHKFVCAGTLEERIDELIERKQEVARYVVGSGEAWLTELSTEELRQIFSLRPEAWEEEFD